MLLLRSVLNDILTISLTRWRGLTSPRHLGQQWARRPQCSDPASRMASPLNDRSSLLALLRTRRSASAKAMGEPGPSGAELDQLIAIATRVPDHGKLAPWRFIVFEGSARARFGEILARRYRALHPGMSEATIDFERARFLRAPVIVGVVSRAGPHPKIPEWEQVLSSGAVCQTLLIAAIAMGYGAQWITEWCAYDAEIAKVLGLAPHERISGFLYLGTATEPALERERPDAAKLVTRWSA
jgi:nitroreductase